MGKRTLQRITAIRYAAFKSLRPKRPSPCSVDPRRSAVSATQARQPGAPHPLEPQAVADQTTRARPRGNTPELPPLLPTEPFARRATELEPIKNGLWPGEIFSTGPLGCTCSCKNRLAQSAFG